MATNRPQCVGHAAVPTPEPAAAELRSCCDGDPSGRPGRRARPTRETDRDAGVRRTSSMAASRDGGTAAGWETGAGHSGREAEGAQPRLTVRRWSQAHKRSSRRCRPTGGAERPARPVCERTGAADGVSVSIAHGRWLRGAPAGRLPDLTTDRNIRPEDIAGVVLARILAALHDSAGSAPLRRLRTSGHSRTGNEPDPPGVPRVATPSSTSSVVSNSSA